MGGWGGLNSPEPPPQQYGAIAPSQYNRPPYPPNHSADDLQNPVEARFFLPISNHADQQIFLIDRVKP